MSPLVVTWIEVAHYVDGLLVSEKGRSLVSVVKVWEGNFPNGTVTDEWVVVDCPKCLDKAPKSVMAKRQ